LLSFGEEAEGEEEELESAIQVLKSKPKSAHDIGDPNLLSKKVYETSELSENKNKQHDSSEESESEPETSKKAKGNENLDMDSIKAKLKKSKADDQKNDKQAPLKTEEPKLSAKEQKKYEFQSNFII
jgi:hypothetical protein